MTTRALLFVLGVALGMLIFGHSRPSSTRQLYRTVKAAEHDGIDGFGSELGSL